MCRKLDSSQLLNMHFTQSCWREPSSEVCCPCTRAELVKVGGSFHGPRVSTTAGSGSLDMGSPYATHCDLILLVYPPTQRISSGSFCSFLRAVPFQFEDLTKELLKNSSEGRGQMSQPVEAFYGICFSSKSLSFLMCTYSGHESFRLPFFSVFQFPVEFMRFTLVLKPHRFQIQIQLWSTSSAQGIMGSPPKSSPSVTICSRFIHFSRSHPPFPLAMRILFSVSVFLFVVYCFCFVLFWHNSCNFYHPNSLPSGS